MCAAAVSRELSFGRFVVQAATRRVLVGGEPARLGARAFDVLMALVERRERVVAKNELLDLVWPGLVVEENNLQVHISALRRLLGPQAIATIPGRGYRFVAVVDGAAEPAGPSSAAAAGGARRTNVPAERPPLYGREADLSALQALVSAHRVVSVVGAGGIGKTVLAQALAHALRGSFDDGTWIVELASLGDGSLLATTAAGVLQLQLGAEAQADALARALGASRMLIVLDNCEHLLPAVAELTRALQRGAPGVHVLATSQEPLKMAGEQAYRLGGLALPVDAGFDDASSAGAVALFEARAREADRRFALTPDNLAAVVDICRHLDGIALAIELAAARVPLLGVFGVRARLHERFRVLTGGARLALRRHQTLRAAFDWSHSLLTADEQTVLRRLGAFAGSFDLDSAQRVAGDERVDEWAVLDCLGALVDKSLVVIDPGAQPRYRLLETGRAFALEQLQQAGETERILNAHAQAMRATFERAYEQQWSLSASSLREASLPDIDNLRAALRWAEAEDAADLLVALAGASAWLWQSAGLRPEGLKWCTRAVARIAAGTPLQQAARLRLALAQLAYPNSLEVPAVEQAVAAYREVGDRRGLYLALVAQAQRCAALRRLADAQAAVDEATALLDPGWPPVLHWSLRRARAWVLGFCGEPEQACALWEDLAREQGAAGEHEAMRASLMSAADQALRVDFEAGIRLGREVVTHMRAGGHRDMSAGFARANLCGALAQQGRQLDEALDLAREAVPLLTLSGALSTFLDHFALLAVRRGRAADAARVLGRARAVAAGRNFDRHKHEQRSHDAALDALQRRLAANELQRLMHEGATLGDEEAARLALRE